MARVQLIEATGYAQAKSTTSLAIGTGETAWTLGRHTAFAAGMTVTADAGGGNTASGTVIAYDPATLALTVDVDSVAGSGTFASWVIGGSRTFYWTTGRGYVGEAFYEPRLGSHVAIERHLSREAVAFGAGSIGFGTIDLVNARFDASEAARPLDDLRTLAWDGGAVTILSIDEADAFETAAVIARGTVERVIYPERDVAQLLWRDPMALLDVPLLTEDFAGTTTGESSGTEGGEEMKGVRRQLCLGTVVRQEPQLANASLNLWFCSLSEMDLTAVTIAGAVQTADTEHGSMAALIAAEVDTATFESHAGATGTWFRAGSAITGPVRFSATEGATGADRTVAQVWKRLLVDWAVDLDASVAAADVTALDTAQDGECGLLIAGDMTIKQAADAIVRGAGADYWQDLGGVWRIRRLVAPSGDPDIKLRRFSPDVIAAADEIELLDWTIDTSDGLPPSQVTLLWGRYAVQGRSELAGEVALEDGAQLGKEWREASYPAEPDTVIKARHKLAERRAIETAWADEAEALEEAERVWELFAEGWLPLDLVAKEEDVAGLLEPGAVLQVTMPAHGFDAGGLMVLRGYRTVPEDRSVVLLALGLGV